MRRKLAAGNWKMNGLSADLAQIETVGARHASATCDVMIAPAATLLVPAVTAAQGRIALGGQDCHPNAAGAHTGDISAQMLADAGATYVITGHSERRADHGETDSLINQKSAAAHDSGLVAVICIGETLEQREAAQTLDIVGHQLAHSVPDASTSGNTVIAYEPVWAIGTGKVPTLGEIAEVHDFIRSRLTERFGTDAHDFRLLYGGSVKPSNAAEIFAVSNVDGALVGGASLKADDFSGIISALETA
ncbi:MAG: triose-phosphate isomerase [Pseudomonadota bacterium]